MPKRSRLRRAIAGVMLSVGLSAGALAVALPAQASSYQTCEPNSWYTPMGSNPYYGFGYQYSHYYYGAWDWWNLKGYTRYYYYSGWSAASNYATGWTTSSWGYQVNCTRWLNGSGSW